MGLTKPGIVKPKMSKQQRLELPKTTTKTGKNQTDMILPTTDECMQQILQGEKNFEFRKYLIPDTVERIWFYVKAPFSCIAYICDIEPGVSRLSRSFAPLPLTGLGNDAFNTRDPSMKSYDYAYYIKSVYGIKDPLHLDEMKKSYGINHAPRGMLYVPERMQQEIWLGDGSRLSAGKVVKVFDRGKRKDKVKSAVIKKAPAVVRSGSQMDVEMDADTDVEDGSVSQQQPAHRPRLSRKRARSSVSMEVSMSSITGLKSRVKRQKI